MASVGWRQAGTLRRRPPVDPGDAEALRRRVRALQKKLREIEKLKVSWTCWEGVFLNIIPICGLMMLLVDIFFVYGNSLKMFPSTISFFGKSWLF